MVTFRLLLMLIGEMGKLNANLEGMNIRRVLKYVTFRTGNLVHF